MNTKLRQVTDCVHGTVYLSEFESSLISTPFFYRLNDVYQSSTVYLTYPSNRTKRYEHSLGVMHLTSKAFFYAVANSDQKARNHLFDSLLLSLSEIKKGVNTSNPGKFYHRIDNEIGEFLLKCIKTIESNINSAKKENILRDLALEHYIPNCFHNNHEKCANDENYTSMEHFVYQSILQSIRIAALFHDVGHPPYSHIIEAVIIELYKDGKNDKRRIYKKYQENKVEELINCIERFIKPTDEQDLHFILLNNHSCKNLLRINDLHERIGCIFLKLAAEQCIPNIIKKVASTEGTIENKAVQILYYITVIEFVFAILTDVNEFFRSLHKIIAGLIDTDKLDYIVRDTKNSGVNWGSVPYERILESVKFVKNPSPGCLFAIAFPCKISDDLDDIIMTRYKVYTRINYHHRCMKTAFLLQSAVRELAYDYLKASPAEKTICPEINTLWTALNYTVGDDRQNIRIIQWNDSWLITALYSACVNLYQDTHKSDKYKQIEYYLQEVLLNKKHYYSLLKRKSDAINLGKSAITYSHIDENYLNDLKLKARNLISTNKNSKPVIRKYMKLYEAIQRLEVLKRFEAQGDFDLLESIFPIGVKKTITRTLEKMKKANILFDYVFVVNPGRNNTGLQKYLKGNSGVYLYDHTDNISAYDVASALSDQVSALRTTCLSFHIFISFPRSSSDKAAFMSEVFDKIAKDLGVAIQNSFNAIIE